MSPTPPRPGQGPEPLERTDDPAVADLHPRLRAILAEPERPDAVPVERQRPDEARSDWKADMRAVDAPAPDMAGVRELDVAGERHAIPCRLFIPHGLAPGPAPLLIYCHGGGFIRGDLDTHDSVCRVLAAYAPCAVLSVGYRLAPEHPAPAALEDVHTVARHAFAHAQDLGIDSGRIAIGGDSAGGNLAAAACLRARDGGGPALTYQLLIYPVTDLTSDTDSKRRFSKGFLLDSMPFYIASYLGAGDGRDPHASPMLAEDLSGLPPALVLTAGHDPLRDEGDAYATRLAAAGVPVEHLCRQDMIHGFISLRGLLPEADDVLRWCAGRLGATLARAHFTER